VIQNSEKYRYKWTKVKTTIFELQINRNKIMQVMTLTYICYSKEKIIELLEKLKKANLIKPQDEIKEKTQEIINFLKRPKNQFIVKKTLSLEIFGHHKLSSLKKMIEKKFPDILTSAPDIQRPYYNNEKLNHLIDILNEITTRIFKLYNHLSVFFDLQEDQEKKPKESESDEKNIGKEIRGEKNVSSAVDKNEIEKKSSKSSESRDSRSEHAKKEFDKTPSENENKNGEELLNENFLDKKSTKEGIDTVLKDFHAIIQESKDEFSKFLFFRLLYTCESFSQINFSD